LPFVTDGPLNGYSEASLVRSTDVDPQTGHLSLVVRSGIGTGALGRDLISGGSGLGSVRLRLRLRVPVHASIMEPPYRQFKGIFG
jgi:hypothetical protein